MVSNYMPDVQVEIAFDSGYTTPAASRTWTDVSSYVELHQNMEITVGRQDERSTADANDLSLTLDNTDGRFTAHRSASPYYPNVKIGRPIRVKVGGPTPGLLLDGTSGSYASTPDGAHLDITGDIDIRVRVAMDDWTPTGDEQVLIAKWGSAGQLSWIFRVNTSGTLNLTGSSNGSAGAFSASSTAATGFTDGTEHWVRVTRDQSSGDHEFFTSDDGETWAQLGATVTSSAGTALFAGTSALAVGARDSGGVTERLAGVIGYAEVRNGIAGTIVADPDFSAQAKNATTFADDSTNTWTVNGSAALTGSRSVRFTGFVDEWPVEWDGSDAYARATIRASSRLARLGLSAKLRSTIEEEILADDPDAYYTLGDPSTSTHAVDSSGANRPRLEPAGTGTEVVFGNATGPGTDGLTAAEFAGGQYLTVGHPHQVGALRVAFNVSSAPAANAFLIESFVGGNGLGVYVATDGTIRLAQIASGVPDLAEPFVTGPVVTDGSTHDAVAVFSDATYYLYVDGALEGSCGAGSLQDRSGMRIGQAFTGTLAHAALYARVDATERLSATRAAEQSTAVLTGFEGDSTDTRLVRILGWAGVAATEIDAETGSETMTYQETTGQSAVDALRDVESTEGGVLFDGTDGDVKFHNRSRRYLASAAATLDMASQHVGSDYAPKLDRSTLANDVTVDNPTTGESARQVDTDSSDEYGVATGSAKSVADSYDPLAQKASWLIASYADPRNRVPSLTVDVLAHQGLTPSAQTLLALTVGDLLAVENAPAQADTTDTSYFIEGYAETIGPESYEITFNLSPTYPTLDTFVLDSATRGLLDTNLLAL